MIENKEIGLKIAENPREHLVTQATENTKQRILQMELGLELERNTLKYLEENCKK